MILDIIIGSIIGLFISVFYDYQFSIILFSIFFSILPDLDFLFYHSIYPINRFSHKHRRLFHLPLLYIFLGIFILKIINADLPLYISFITISLYHFLHDTFSLGFGIQWLYPFTKKHFLFNKEINTSKKVFWKIHSDIPENIDKHADIYGDDNWLKKSLFK